MAFLIFIFSFLQVNASGHDLENGEADFNSSNLPIVIIDTHGQNIPVNERIIGEMGIIWNSENERNYLSDPRNNYDGRIEIELHGQSSLAFPKNSFRIETQDSLGENANVSLLGMPKENDWILYAPYSDKTLMRNALSYTLAGEINEYAPRVKFCELILNDAYHGVYVLTERIKRDNNRIDITEMLPGDLAEPEISGGYIFKKDKDDFGDNIIKLARGLELIIIEPPKDEIVPAQTNWLRNHLNNFENALYSAGNYGSYIDVQSFVDNFLLVELTKNIDGLRLSTYFYKDRNDKIDAGPVWDYNFSFGNADYNDGWTPVGWYYPIISWDNNWCLELIKDPVFYDLCVDRWKGLRQNQFNISHIFLMIDEWTTLLEEAQERNFTLYPILGTYVWPNPGFPESGSYGFNAPTNGGAVTWEEEIEFMKDFIRGRLQWIDEQFNLELVDLTVDIIEKGWGHILYNNRIISNETYLGSFPNNESVILRAESLPGYEFVQWEEITTGEETTTWINKGALWKYLDDGSDQGTAWYSNFFDDSLWKEGAAKLGYGDNDETTVVSYGPDSQNKYITTYFRKSFNVANPDSYLNLTLYLLRDDGAVVYLNGHKAVRSNMPGTTINYDTFAAEFVSGDDEKTFYPFVIDSQYLIEGENIIAVEIHQQNLTSSDISFDLNFAGTGVNQESDTTIIGINESLTYLPVVNSTIRGVFKPVEGYSSELVINEIHYNPLEGENFEFIELYNNSDSTLNLSNYSFDQGIEFAFPIGSAIDPGDFIILANDSTSYSNLNCPVFQWTSGNLLNDGELLLMVDTMGNTVDSVNFSNESPWPEEANGAGFSLELKNTYLNNSLAENWQRSYRPGGSPGQPTVRIINTLYINEFLASNFNTNQDESSEYDDWIELYNAGDEAIDIGGLYLSDDKDKPAIWKIPVISPYTTTIVPESFLLLWADGDTSQGILHLGFQLNKSGETISITQIVNDESILIDSIKYSEQISDVSMGRFPDGGDVWQSFIYPTPGSKNIITSIVEEELSLVKSFGLSQNYPNPFNPVTTINYQLKVQSDVKLKIYDVLGREIETLVNKRQPAGKYSVKFDASGLPSGVYIYRLNADSFKQSHKMILLR